MFKIIQSAQAAETITIGNLAINIWWWPYLFATVKYFLIFLTVVFIVAVILILVRIQGGFKVKIREAVEEAMEAGRLPKTKIQREWDVILADVDSNKPEDYRKAVVLAEKLFEKVLKAAKFSGENLEMRLKKVPDNQLEFKEDILWAYRLKNNILSDENIEINPEEARRAVNVFQKALKELNVL